jgi:AcrR family transcriptional regulator
VRYGAGPIPFDAPLAAQGSNHPRSGAVGDCVYYSSNADSSSVSCIGAALPFRAEVGLAMDKPDPRPPPSLIEEQRELTRSRIRHAAMEVVARRGFDATVDEIARVSGVSPRTIFRHYASRDRLIVSTVKDMFDACGRPMEGVPGPSDDVDGWIEGLGRTIHTRNAEILGESFWDIHAPSRNASAVLSEVDALRRESRVRGVHYLAILAWQKAGGTGEPPDALVSAFALNFSAFTTQALMVDFDQTPAQIGALTADILKELLRRAVDAQRERADADDGEG